MIISASRRTDIPAYYSDWFFNRIKEGYVVVRNPMNPHHISRLDLSPVLVDCIVFWTKNPAPMIKRINELKDYTYYFQFTITPYGKEVEPYIPDKTKAIIPTFQQLSDIIGKERVIWRYDPIFLSKRYSIQYHTEYFYLLVQELKDYTHKCIISFIDLYKNTAKNLKELDLHEIAIDQKRLLAKNLAEIAISNGLKIDACAEDISLEDFDIFKAKCVDDKLIEELSGYSLDIKKDKNQRSGCGCVTSSDIGMYNTCLNGCKYCYANFNYKVVDSNYRKHDKDSPLLCGNISANDIVKNTKAISHKNTQLNLF